MKKLNWIEFEKKITQLSLTIFSPKDIGQIFSVSLRAAQGFINYYQKKEVILKIKKNFYCLSNRPPNDFAIASFVYQPSYISLESALSFYGALPEIPYSITSLTPKRTSRFVFLNKEFVYQRIKPALFFGYELTAINNEKFYLAKKEKAILDYLYFIFLKKKSWNQRINLRVLKLDKRLLKNFLERFVNKNFIKFCLNFKI